MSNLRQKHLKLGNMGKERKKENSIIEKIIMMFLNYCTCYIKIYFKYHNQMKII